MTTILDRAGVILFGDDSDLQAALNRAQSSMQSAGQSMQQVGRTLSTRVTLPLAAMGAASVKAFADFDGAMTQSLAIMGDVSDTMRTDMEAAARSVSRTTTVSATEAAEAYFFLASAGLSAEQSIAALPQVAAFAQAGMFDMSTATDLATDAQSALGLTVSDAVENLENLTRVTDVLVRANTLANATVQQFSEALTTEAGSALKTFNKDVEEGVAVLAVFADQGIKGQVAGSGLSRVMRLMSQAAVNNRAEMQELGIQFFDAQGNMRNMADVVENLTDVLGPMSDEQRAAALESIGFTARVQGIIQPLLGTSDAIREYEAALREAGGTTVEVAENQMASFSAQMTVAKNNLQNAAIIIGDVLGPTLIKLGELLGAAARRFEAMSPATQKLIIGVVALVAAVGPLLVMLGTLSVAIGAITAPVALAVAAFAALVAAGVAIVDNWAVIRFETRRLMDFMREQWDRFFGFVGRIREQTEAVAGFFRDLKDRVVGNSFIPEMIDGIQVQFQRLQGVMVEPARAATEQTSDLFSQLSTRVQQTSDRAADALVDFATGSENAIHRFVEAAIKDLARLLAKMLLFRALSAAIGIFSGGGSTVLQVGAPIGGGGGAVLASVRSPEVGVLSPAAAAGISANVGGGGGASLSESLGRVLDRLGPPPGPMPPELMATHDFYRQFISEALQDFASRGGSL